MAVHEATTAYLLGVGTWPSPGATGIRACSGVAGAHGSQAATSPALSRTFTDPKFLHLRRMLSADERLKGIDTVCCGPHEADNTAARRHSAVSRRARATKTFFTCVCLYLTNLCAFTCRIRPMKNNISFSCLERPSIGTCRCTDVTQNPLIPRDRIVRWSVTQSANPMLSERLQHAFSNIRRPDRHIDPIKVWP